MTIKDFAEAVGRSEKTIQNQVAKGRIRSKLIGPIRWIPPSEVERYRRESLGQAKGGRRPAGPRTRRAPRP